jgi:hypothetical protein
VHHQRPTSQRLTTGSRHALRTCIEASAVNGIQKVIEQRQAELAKHAFFQRLSGTQPPDEVLAFVAAPTFFVLTFQDILRLNEAKIRDPELQKIARLHRREDSGHDDWFLHDLAVVEGKVPDVRSLFGRAHERTRDASFELVSEVFRATNDSCRIVVVLILEAGGHIMFDRMAEYLERSRFSKELKYFSRGHLNVELDHSLFADGIDELLAKIVLSPAERSEAEALVDRGFAALHRLLDGFEQRILDKISPAAG